MAAGYGWVVLHPTMLVLDNDSQKHIAAISDVLGSPSEQEGALVWSLRGVEQR